MTNDFVTSPEVVVAARELLRAEGDGCAVSIGQLLGALNDKLGERFPVSPQMYQVVDLIEELWADAHIDQVTDIGMIEFAWNQAGRQPRENTVADTVLG